MKTQRSSWFSLTSPTYTVECLVMKISQSKVTSISSSIPFIFAPWVAKYWPLLASMNYWSILCLLPLSLCKPTQQPFNSRSKYFDVQVNLVSSLNVEKFWQCYHDQKGHRGGRGEVVESTLPAFAWWAIGMSIPFFFANEGKRGLILGATTLELDNGITKVIYLLYLQAYFMLTLGTGWRRSCLAR